MASTNAKAANIQALRTSYPWTKFPLICSAPMRLLATPELAVEVTLAGGLGFISAGMDSSVLPSQFQAAHDLLANSQSSPDSCLPIGVGFINWAADMQPAMQEIKKWKPAAAWFFGPKDTEDLVLWARETRKASPGTNIWVQVGTVAMALAVAEACCPDVLVIQGADAGGHGLAQSSSIITLLPECKDSLERAGLGHIPLIAAGGIVEGRGVAAAYALGASGIVMGSRFLASKEANISAGYQKAILDSADGGTNTVRTRVYDKLRGTNGWPDGYDARGIINKTYADHAAGMTEEENKRLYEQAMGLGEDGWGIEGRISTYAGTGVGLIREVKPAREIVKEVRDRARTVSSEMITWL